MHPWIITLYLASNLTMTHLDHGRRCTYLLGSPSLVLYPLSTCNEGLMRLAQQTVG